MAKDYFEIAAQGSRVAHGFLIVCTGLFGVFFVVGGLDRLSRPFEAYFFIALGIAIIVLAFRLALFWLLPAFKITDSALIARRVLRPKAHWRFDALKGFETTVREIDSGRWGRPSHRRLFVEDLHAVFLNGSRQSIMLPGFEGTNEPVIKALESRSLLSVKRHRERGPKLSFVERLLGRTSNPN